ncbi:MAG: hypothetical protein HFE63_07585 [Clostridiales bacterium]|nr:hypothetical protein [Clostridiales bacterium]
MTAIQSRAFELMKLWCDTLLKYEVKSDTPYTDGALLCPACHVVHGRIADLAYPLTTLWAHTGDERYLTAAERLVDWTEFNLKRPDGSWRNDAGNNWKCISAFAAIGIAETLIHFKDKLPKPLAEKWNTIFIRLANFCYDKMESFDPVINYYAGAAAVLAIAWQITGEQRYLDKANEWEAICRKHFDEQGLFFGEGHPIDVLSDKGCRAIDMGYNLEESLPLLLRHSIAVGDTEKLEFYKARLYDHLYFMLPDGAIDNSWGSRHNKWTYWGSRTSDGVIEALALVMDNYAYAKTCKRVLDMYERCTHDGLLGLPMAHDAGEPTCLHHSFCHAKALASLVNEDIPELVDVDFSLLPCEEAFGVREYQNGNLLLVSTYAWRATFSACDLVFYSGADNAGGSMTLLWNGDYGPVCAATMDKYIPSEPLNMQYLRHADDSPCMTPRLIINGIPTIRDRNAKLEYSIDGFDISVTASGDGWKVCYSFGESALKIDVQTDIAAIFALPIICNKSTPAVIDGNVLFVGDKLTLRADSPLNVDVNARIFNQVGGFEYLPVEIECDGKASLKITIA